MTAHGKDAGIEFNFGGTIANTLHAHRVVQHFQEEKGVEVAGKIVDCMFPLPYLWYWTRCSVLLTLLCATLHFPVDSALMPPRL